MLEHHPHDGHDSVHVEVEVEGQEALREAELWRTGVPARYSRSRKLSGRLHKGNNQSLITSTALHYRADHQIAHRLRSVPIQDDGP